MQKKKQKPERVSKPYLTGRMIDRSTLGGALKFFASTLLLVFVYFMSMAANTDKVSVLSVVINAGILLVTWMVYWQNGMASGADAVTQGEIMFQRQEKGRPVESWEKEQCFHPLKGAVAALFGTLPLLICAVILACMAKRQMTSLGTLPGWVSAFEGRQEIGGALAYYHQEAALTLEGVLRLIVRMAVMPWVNLLGASNKDMMLLVERISPVLVLLPAISYGLGYFCGPQERVAVHSNIALGKKKQKKKQARERRKRQVERRGPEQLN